MQLFIKGRNRKLGLAKLFIFSLQCSNLAAKLCILFFKCAVVDVCVYMDYRARGSWIGNARGRFSKAGYGGSDVTFNNFIFINSSWCEVSFYRCF